MTAKLKRREFITLLGGAAAWPLAAGAQQGDRVRRIGVLMPAAADDRDAQDRLAAFLQGLQQSGWSVGRNVRIEYSWSSSDVDSVRKSAADLVALAPDVILANGSAAMGPLLRVTRRCTSRVCSRRRPGWRRLCRQPSAARRQRHRICPVRIRTGRQVAGAAQRGRTARDAGGGHSGCFGFRRGGSVRGNPVGGAVVRG